ncbi:receptor-type tyrosine-protein phosphatase H [Arapaima gigas]
MALLLLWIFVAQVWTQVEANFSIAAPTIPTTTPPINCSHWDVTRTSIEGYIPGNFSDATASSATPEVPTVIANITDNRVFFACLSPGCKYNLTILDGTKKLCEHSEATVAAPVSEVKISAISSTSLSVSWNNASGCVREYIIYLNNTIAAPVSEVKISAISSTSLSVSWNNASGCVREYIIYLNNTSNVTQKNSIEYHDLTPGCPYTANVTTVGFGNHSAVIAGNGATVAAPVSEVKISAISSTSLSVSWNNASGCVREYIIYLNNTRNVTQKNSIEYHDLTPGCPYTASVTTVGFGNHSAVIAGNGATVPAPVRNITVTPMNSTALRVTWDKAPGCVQIYSVTVNNTVKNTKSTSVEFPDLLPGHNYTVNIKVKGDGGLSSQESRNANTYPAQLRDVSCHYASSGYSIALSWPRPPGVWTRVEVQVAGGTVETLPSTETSAVVGGVQPARTYLITLTAFSGDLRSPSTSLRCTADPRGVIAGSVMAVVLLALVILAVVFVLRFKPFRAVPADKFADHVCTLSCDENRGFSVEYEDFSTVGLEQKCTAALLPDNKPKNRFTNVLPYDWSRVRLTTLDGDVNSDYINASYMPGYGNNSRQYIATQGPLRSTVNDFWRMIWEQNVKAVVMVTNCTEGGRAKCEQYWPLDYTPCTYGELGVLVTSEQKYKNWIVREFKVTNKMTSGARTVKHFHFTAWPDHGVPDSTSALIEYRGLVRHHIESSFSLGPTVVHCSAGVGRTGTFIALDVALQELRMEKAVSPVAIVHKMRLHRPLMVQTESQYIFLHQCILDSLNEQKANEEPIYENANTDLLYVNATALRDFHANSELS